MISSQFKAWLERWTSPPSTTSPDDALRRKLLNVLVLNTAGVAIMGFLFTTVALNFSWEARLTPLFAASGTLLFTSALIYVINQHVSGWLAGTLFLVGLLAMLFFDEPYEVALGRSGVYFTLPIVLSSVLLRPYASFFTAGISSLIIGVVAVRLDAVPNFFTMLLFFGLAVVSWVSARTLEQALGDLRTANRELEQLNADLDRRVKERTRELDRALTQLQAVLNGIADGVIVFDPDDVALLVNPAAGLLLGKAPGDLVGKGARILFDALSEEKRAEVLAFYRGADVDFPSIKFRWSPTERTLSMSAAPVVLEDGERLGRVIVLRDYTREAQIDEMKSTFITIASHELRTPLSAVQGYSEMLLEGTRGELSREQTEIVERLCANAGVLENLVNNLLDQAQIEAGTLEIRDSLYSVEDLIEDVVENLKVIAEGRRLELICEVGSGIPAVVRGDRVRVHQILMNLTGNALKFTQEGSVSIEVSRPDEGHFALTVRDTGPGIPESEQARIFEPFEHVDSGLTRRNTGAGLGLSIVGQLVELMGGRIELESEVGRGSAFTVTLPLSGGGSEPKAEGQDGRSDALIVEDDYDLSLLCASALENAGFSAQIADSASVANRFLERRRPDVVVLDIHLPQGSGLEVLKRIDDYDPPISVIVITADERAAERVRDRVAVTLVKPFSFHNLAQMARRLADPTGKT